MDTRENNNSNQPDPERRRALTLPVREPRVINAQQPVAPHPQPVAGNDTAAIISPTALAAQRESLGFDDIPIDNEITVEGTSFRQIFGVWIKQAFKHSAIEEKQQRVGRYLRDKEFLAWKDDLKWALKADLDDQTHQPKAPPVAVAPRRLVVPPRPPQTHPVRSTVITAPPVQSNKKSIDITINFNSLPNFPKLPKLSALPKKPTIPGIKTIFRRLLGLSRQQKIMAGCVVVIVGIVIFNASHFLGKHPINNTIASSNQQVTSTSLPKGTPDYSTVLPSGKSIESLGGWSRVSPPDKNPVYAYADKIGDVQIAISEQPLPDTFRSNISSSIEQLAKGYAATDKITVGSITAYIGTSGQGPQSVILTKNDLLILIKSTNKIDDTHWGNYINSLQ